MRDITGKQITLRTATAEGFVLCAPETERIIKEGKLPKGDPFGVAKAAGLLGAKQTENLIPHCHPVSIDGMDLDFELLGGADGKYGVTITCSARSIGRTGIEMEALTAVSVAGLTIYDLLKPVDKDISITGIRLLDKTGGKSDRVRFTQKVHRCAVLVCSDSTAAGKREDRSGILISKMLEAVNAKVEHYVIIPDEPEQIEEHINSWVKQDVEYIFTTGVQGWGLAIGLWIPWPH